MKFSFKQAYNSLIIITLSIIIALCVRSYAVTTVALCLVTKDEEIDLLEWVDYHRSIGVTHIIIMDNNSSTPAIDTILHHVRSGFILHYSYFSHRAPSLNNQLYAYRLCLASFGRYFSHMGFIDTDEFIVIKNRSSTIIDILNKYTGYGGLTLNSMLIGSSGHVKRPKGGILANYNKCQRNSVVKTIVATGKTTSVTASGNPHNFHYKHGSYAIDTNFHRVDGPCNPSDCGTPKDSLYDVAYINHYVLKSLEDYQIKLKRGSGDGGQRSTSFFQSLNNAIGEKSCDYLRPHTN